MVWKKVPREPEDDHEELKAAYDAMGEKLLDLVQDAEKAGLPPAYVMNLLLDKAIALVYFIAPSEEQATAVIEAMQREVREKLPPQR
tara:strand:- start:3560 stop:3820 length:261 start_codon:yes stop_codon:yes gene_type:complete